MKDSREGNAELIKTLVPKFCMIANVIIFLMLDRLVSHRENLLLNRYSTAALNKICFLEISSES